MNETALLVGWVVAVVAIVCVILVWIYQARKD